MLPGTPQIVAGFGRKSRVAQMYPYPLQANSWAVEARPGVAAKLDFHLHLLQLQQATLCCYSSSSSRSDSGKSNARKASESDSGSSKLELTHPTILGKIPLFLLMLPNLFPYHEFKS